MDSTKKVIVFGGGALLAAVVAVVLLVEARPACDSPSAVATLKEMARDKIRSYQGAQFFLRNALSADRFKIVMTDNQVVLTLSAFRDRGAFGKGSSCAAQVSVHTEGQTSKADFATEYTIEPASGGEIMVSAKFMPN